jgi:A1 cistron-splicing factor AAR2
MSSVVALGLPVGYNFGIDMQMWEVGGKFRGITKVPQGLHFIYYSPPGDELRQGFFHYFVDGEVIVRKWDAATELLIGPLTCEELDHIKNAAANDFSIIHGLAPFNQCVKVDSLHDWQSAICFITPDVLDKISPINSQDFRSTQQESASLQMEDVPTIFWSTFSKFKIPEGSSASDVTRYYMDKMAHLLQVTESNYPSNPTGLLGEMQAAFILFLLGQNYESFLQWRQLIELFLGCREQGITEHMQMFEDFVFALEFQLKQLPEDLITDSTLLDDDSNHRAKPIFLIPLLMEFLSACRDVADPTLLLVQRCERLQSVMASKFGKDWNEWEDDDEDKPVIVET